MKMSWQKIFEKYKNRLWIIIDDAMILIYVKI